MGEDIQTWEIKEPWVHTKCVLGEGPCHEESTGRLRFLDIESNRMFWIDPKKGPESLERLDLKEPVGFSADIENDPDRLIVGAKYGFAYLTKATGQLDYLTSPSQFWTSESEKADASKPQRMRFNDGNIDAHGRFWCGMINDTKVHPFSPEGALFCLSADGAAVTRHIEGVTISNGLGWSADGRTMYFTDSPRKTIVAFDFDPASGAISNERPWFDGKPELGGDDAPLPVPDGFCQDTEGGFWVALYGGAKVIRLVDDGGRARKVGEVRLPTRHVTCPRLLGSTLWITTGGDDKGEGTSKELGGALFSVEVGYQERKMHKWKKGPA